MPTSSCRPAGRAGVAYSLVYDDRVAPCDERRFVDDVQDETGMRVHRLDANRLLPFVAGFPESDEPQPWPYAGRNWAMLRHIRADREHQATTAAGSAAGGRIVCASGISPSGPIHLGNLREVMTVHLVAEELTSRGHDAVHLHSWDDDDRFRKVPAGIDERFAEHIGKPLSAVPDPCGQHESWSAHFRTEFGDALAVMGVGPARGTPVGQLPAR